MANCEVYSTVDFGRGPVSVRCTEVGEHTQHRCVVFINDEEGSPWRSANIFEPPTLLLNEE